MDKAAFDQHFTDRVTKPLDAAGWESHGKTLLRGDLQGSLGLLALIRFSGKKTRAGSIVHMIGFRHRFLRELVDLTVPDLLPKQHNDWPLRARPQEFGGWWGRPKLKPFSFGEPMEIEYLRWERRPLDEVLADLDGLRACLEGPVTKWARSYTPKRVQKELLALEEPAFVERMWLEDYEKHLAGA